MITKENKIAEKTLIDLGFDEKDSLIYLALLNNGPMLPQNIARVTGLKRTTLYNLFPILIKSGAIKEITQGKRRLLSANSPEDLFKNYEEKYKEVKTNIAELASVYRLQGLKPKIEMYEGTEGVKEAFLDSLNTKRIDYFMQMINFNEEMRKWVLSEYVPTRIRKGIKTRAIVPDKAESQAYHNTDEGSLREARYVPWDKYHFRIECMIYEDRVSFITCEKGSPLVAIIIQSKQIAETQRAMFNLAWEGAEKYQTQPKTE